MRARAEQGARPVAPRLRRAEHDLRRPRPRHSAQEAERRRVQRQVRAVRRALKGDWQQLHGRALDEPRLARAQRPLRARGQARLHVLVRLGLGRDRVRHLPARAVGCAEPGLHVPGDRRDDRPAEPPLEPRRDVARRVHRRAAPARDYARCRALRAHRAGGDGYAWRLLYPRDQFGAPPRLRAATNRRRGGRFCFGDELSPQIGCAMGQQAGARARERVSGITARPFGSQTRVDRPRPW
mmetsp:Transcript_4654/g.14366  ORF Transcript_4654/g.14366 Transcript_4654/m.14366 type:complete len:239 (+) Transcript_4654:874-1590(+)